MKKLKPKQCTSIEEVRSEIDEIDRYIISLLGERSKYVEAASRYKKDKESVKASERVKSMLIQRKKWASENSLDPVFIEQLFRNITSHFIEKEKHKWIIENQFAIDEVKITEADQSDLPEILALQIISYQSEALINNDFEIAPLLYTMSEIEKEFKEKIFLKAVFQDMILGSVRGYRKNDICYLGKLIVHPDYQNLGIGKMLMLSFEKYFRSCKASELFTGTNSVKNINLYKKMGYEAFKEEKLNDKYGFIYLRKNLSH